MVRSQSCPEAKKSITFSELSSFFSQLKDNIAKDQASNSPTNPELQDPEVSKLRVINTYGPQRPKTWAPTIAQFAQPVPVPAATAVQQAQEPYSKNLVANPVVNPAWYERLKYLMQVALEVNQARKHDRDFPAEQQETMRCSEQKLYQYTGNLSRQTARGYNTVNTIPISSDSQEGRHMFPSDRGILSVTKTPGLITSQARTSAESRQPVPLPKPSCLVVSAPPAQGRDSKTPQMLRNTTKSQNHLPPMDGNSASRKEDSLKKWLPSLDSREPHTNRSQGETTWQPSASIKLPDENVLSLNENPPEDPLISAVEYDPKEPVIRSVSSKDSFYDSKKENNSVLALVQLSRTNVRSKSVQPTSTNSAIIRPKQPDANTTEALSPIHFATSNLIDPLVEPSSVTPAEKKGVDLDLTADLEDFQQRVVKALWDLKRQQDALRLYIKTTFDNLCRKLEHQIGKDGRGKPNLKQQPHGLKNKSSKASQIDSRRIFEDLRSAISGDHGFPLAPVEEELVGEARKRKRSRKGGGKQNKEQKTMDTRVTGPESTTPCEKRKTPKTGGIKKNDGGNEEVSPSKVQCSLCVKQKFYRRKYLPKHIANVHSQNKKKRKASKTKVNSQAAQTSTARKSLSFNLAQQMLIYAEKLNLPHDLGIYTEKI